LAALRDGLWQERKVRIRYGSAPFTVGPLGLVAKKYHWYLVGLRDDGRIRTYKVQRLQVAELTDEPFERPAGFDLAEHWRRSSERYFAQLRDFPVRLRVRDTVLHRLRWAPNATVDSVAARSGGWSQVSMTFERPDETRIFLLGLAGDVIVLDPPALRADLVRAAQTLVGQHERS
jgi:predicted DNA-binding transcriptional regulator YafY